MVVFLVTLVAGFFFPPIWILSVLIAYEEVTGNKLGGSSDDETDKLSTKIDKLVSKTNDAAQVLNANAECWRIRAEAEAADRHERAIEQRRIENVRARVELQKSLAKDLEDPLFAELYKDLVAKENTDLPKTKPILLSGGGCAKIPPITIALQGIKHVYHFTNCKNLNSILKHGILPVSVLQSNKIDHEANDSLRLDGKLNAVSLSISFPNYKMFYKYRKQNLAEDWAVLQIRRDIISSNCSYFERNAADHRMRLRSNKESNSLEAFFRLFRSSETVDREALNLPKFYPTDPQAEVLAFKRIPPEAITGIFFETPKVMSRWAFETLDWEGDVAVDKNLFGVRKTFSSSEVN